MGFDKIAVIGFLGFGLLALEYARKYPEHISYVILIGAFPDFKTETRKRINEFFESDASEERKKIIRANDETLTEEMLSKMSPKRAFEQRYIAHAAVYWYDPTYDCSWVWEGMEYNIDAFIHYFYVILEDYDLTQYLQDLTKPVFLALGRYDYAAPYILWDDIIDEIPNLTYNLFEKSGHWPMLEEQALFDKKLIGWITNS